jgi:hypothetical protein
MGRSVPVTARIRLVTGPNGEGARRLASQADLIYNTFKNLTRALSTKFALNIVKPERNLPAIYAVYDDRIDPRTAEAGRIHRGGPQKRPGKGISERRSVAGTPAARPQRGAERKAG